METPTIKKTLLIKKLIKSMFNVDVELHFKYPFDNDELKSSLNVSYKKINLYRISNNNNDSQFEHYDKLYEYLFSMSTEEVIKWNDRIYEINKMETTTTTTTKPYSTMTKTSGEFQVKELIKSTFNIDVNLKIVHYNTVPAEYSISIIYKNKTIYELPEHQTSIYNCYDVLFNMIYRMPNYDITNWKNIIKKINADSKKSIINEHIVKFNSLIENTLFPDIYYHIAQHSSPEGKFLILFVKNWIFYISSPQKDYPTAYEQAFTDLQFVSKEAINNFLSLVENGPAPFTYKTNAKSKPELQTQLNNRFKYNPTFNVFKHPNTNEFYISVLIDNFSGTAKIPILYSTPSTEFDDSKLIQDAYLFVSNTIDRIPYRWTPNIKFINLNQTTSISKIITSISSTQANEMAKVKFMVAELLPKVFNNNEKTSINASYDNNIYRLQLSANDETYFLEFNNNSQLANQYLLLAYLAKQFAEMQSKTTATEQQPPIPLDSKSSTDQVVAQINSINNQIAIIKNALNLK